MNSKMKESQKSMWERFMGKEKPTNIYIRTNAVEMATSLADRHADAMLDELSKERGDDVLRDDGLVKGALLAAFMSGFHHGLKTMGNMSHATANVVHDEALKALLPPDPKPPAGQTVN